MRKPAKVLSALLGAATLFGATVAPAFAASPPPIELPSQFTDAYLWARGGSYAWDSTNVNDAVLWGLALGVSQGVMNPAGTLTRGQAAIFLARAMGARPSSPDPVQSQATVPFSDVSATGNVQVYHAVQILVSDGVLNTSMYPGGKLDPSGNITRAELAAWIDLALKYYGAGGTQSLHFSDVPTSGSIQAGGAVIPVGEVYGAAASGVINGYPDHTFKPDAFISRGEMLAMLVRFVKALPGSEQLLMQTPYLQAIMTSTCVPPGAPLGNGYQKPQSCLTGPTPTATISTNANVPTSILATTISGWNALPYVTWTQIHEWIATGNWIALGEAKLSSQETTYVANYGLPLWDEAEVALAEWYYAPSYQGAPLLQVWSGGNPQAVGWGAGSVPVNPGSIKSIQLANTTYPWASGLPVGSAPTASIWFNIYGTSKTNINWAEQIMLQPLNGKQELITHMGGTKLN